MVLQATSTLHEADAHALFGSASKQTLTAANAQPVAIAAGWHASLGRLFGAAGTDGRLFGRATAIFGTAVPDIADLIVADATGEG